MAIPQLYEVPAGLAQGWRQIRNSLPVVVASVTAAVLLRLFVVEALYVPSRSMESAILPGDYLLVNKLIAKGTDSHAETPAPIFRGFRNIERGDVLVFDLPAAADAQGTRFVKRCVGLPGDTVTMDDGDIYVNGNVFRTTGTHAGFAQVVVPKPGEHISLNPGNLSQWSSLIGSEGHSVRITETGEILIDELPSTGYVVRGKYYFVLGDNINESYDSRAWGLVPETNVAGTAILIYWSLDPFSGIRWDRIGALVR